MVRKEFTQFNLSRTHEKERKTGGGSASFASCGRTRKRNSGHAATCQNRRRKSRQRRESYQTQSAQHTARIYPTICLTIFILAAPSPAKQLHPAQSARVRSRPVEPPGATVEAPFASSSSSSPSCAPKTRTGTHMSSPLIYPHPLSTLYSLLLFFCLLSARLFSCSLSVD